MNSSRFSGSCIRFGMASRTSEARIAPMSLGFGGPFRCCCFTDILGERVNAKDFFFIVVPSGGAIFLYCTSVLLQYEVRSTTLVIVVHEYSCITRTPLSSSWNIYLVLHGQVR